MKVPPGKLALREIGKRLKELLDSRGRPGSLRESKFFDAEIRIQDKLFLIEWKASGDAAAVGAGVRQLRSVSSSAREDEVLLLAVPFMGEAGQSICRESGVSWLDLSGNARIEAPGWHIRVEGRENQFKRRGRPSSPFAPKSSRITRWLLMNSKEFHAQRELAAATGMGEGFTSRIVRRLEELDLLERNQLGAVRARDPNVLLRAWAEAYDFERHHILRGHVVARSGEELLGRVGRTLSDRRIEYAATGLAGAWLLTYFAGFRTVICYVSELPERDVLESIGFHEEVLGANLWLVLPKDEGVFQGMLATGDRPCVHPVQAWLDLKNQPERSEEAAQQLEKILFNLGRHA